MRPVVARSASYRIDSIPQEECPMAIHRRIRAFAACAAIASCAGLAGAQPYDVFFPSLEGIFNIGGTDTGSILGEAVVDGFVTVDAKNGTVGELAIDLVEFSNGFALGFGEVSVEPLVSKGMFAEFPMIGKSRVTDRYTELYDIGFNFLDGTETYTEKIAVVGRGAAGADKVAAGFKYGRRYYEEYSKDLVEETQAGTVAIVYGSEHKGRSPIVREYADTYYGLFMMDEPVANAKLGDFRGPAIFITNFLDPIKAGATLEGGTAALAIKPSRPDGALGTYKTSASLGFRRYRDSGLVAIDAATLGGIEDLEDIYDGFDFLFNFAATTPASIDTYRARVQR